MYDMNIYTIVDMICENDHKIAVVASLLNTEY